MLGLSNAWQITRICRVVKVGWNSFTKLIKCSTELSLSTIRFKIHSVTKLKFKLKCNNYISPYHAHNKYLVQIQSIPVFAAHTIINILWRHFTILRRAVISIITVAALRFRHDYDRNFLSQFRSQNIFGAKKIEAKNP